jgi:hypothetical protein
MTNILPCSNLTLNEQRSGQHPVMLVNEKDVAATQGYPPVQRILSGLRSEDDSNPSFLIFRNWFMLGYRVAVQIMPWNHGIPCHQNVEKERMHLSLLEIISVIYSDSMTYFIGSFVPSVFSEARYPYFWDIHYSVMLTQSVHGNFGILHPKIFFLNAGMSILWNIDFVEYRFCEGCIACSVF